MFQIKRLGLRHGVGGDVYAGAECICGSAKGVVTAIGDDTALGERIRLGEWPPPAF